MSCTGNCCENFPLPLSKEMLKRRAQESKNANGSLLEMRMIADMVIPIQKEAFYHGDKRYFWFTCKHFDKQTRKCTIYEKRPVMCRTYPDKYDKIQHCKASLYNGCELSYGTPRHVANEEFVKANNL